MIIETKNMSIARDLLLYSYDDKLIKILTWIEEKQPWFKMIFTAGFYVGDSGIHGTKPCRAVDLRCHDQTIGYYTERAINNTWEYDYKRPQKSCALYHTATGKEKDFHLHIQVHTNTRVRR